MGYIVSTSKGTVTPLQPSEPAESAFEYPLHFSMSIWGSTFFWTKCYLDKRDCGLKTQAIKLKI